MIKLSVNIITLFNDGLFNAIESIHEVNLWLKVSVHIII